MLSFALLDLHISCELIGGTARHGSVHEPGQFKMVFGGILVAVLVHDGLTVERDLLCVVREELGELGIEVTVVVTPQDALVGVYSLVGMSHERVHLGEVSQVLLIIR